MTKKIAPLQKSVRVFSETLRCLKMSKNHNSDISALKIEWAQRILNALGVELTIKGVPTLDPGVLFVGNHISYLDIPILMSLVNDISFVAKQELKSWPIFGRAAKTVQTVFVKRESDKSRSQTRSSIIAALDEGRRIAIFPSGTTSLNEHRDWRRGAFEIAHATGKLIQPFRLTYHPLRTAAYIDDDVFPFHLYELGRLSEIKAEIEFHPPQTVSDPKWDCLHWQYWSKGLFDATSSEMRPAHSQSI